MNKLLISTCMALVLLVSACTPKEETISQYAPKEIVEIPSSTPYELIEYTSEGFSFSYPSTWRLMDEMDFSKLIYFISAERLSQMNSGSYHGKIGDMLIQVYGSVEALPNNDGTYTSLEDFLSPLNTYTLNDKKVPFELDGIAGYRNVYSPFDGSEVVYLDRDGIIYEINLGTITEFMDIKEEILNSISFN